MTMQASLLLNATQRGLYLGARLSMSSGAFCRYASTLNAPHTSTEFTTNREFPEMTKHSSSDAIARNSFRSLEQVTTSKEESLMESDPYQVKILWKHPGFERSEMRQVKVAHHQPECWQDRVALKALHMIRKSFDFVTGYKHAPAGQEASAKYQLTTAKWLQRFIFLESIAGVPGMVGGMVRHLHSLRVMNRDKAWIESLIEESYNERMHLMSFIKIAHPSRTMRLMLLGAQGVFFNMFFVAYLLFPRICHRFVGYLEEEAVVTYTRCIDDMEHGRLPDFADMKAPDIALKYWKMPEDATVKDLIYYIRADESKHREVNHTLGNLKQKTDPNPYNIDYSHLPSGTPRPTEDLKFANVHPVGWKRDEIKF